MAALDNRNIVIQFPDITDIISIYVGGMLIWSREERISINELGKHVENGHELQDILIFFNFLIGDKGRKD